MSVEEFNPARTTPKQRRVAAIFLSAELKPVATDPFLYSQGFYEAHQEVLPRGFGIISGVLRPYEEHGVLRVPRETISFDARGMQEEGEFSWQLCYGDRGAQKIARLWAQQESLSVEYAETSNQGAITKHFLLEQDEAEQVSAHLLERLVSPEVEACIQEAYVRRQNLEVGIAKLVLEKNGEESSRRSTPSFLDKKIAGQEALRATTGFAMMLVFDEHRLKVLRAEQPTDL